jgi:hypothetical protein
MAEKEFLFVDESGDPGVVGNPLYILAAMHVDLGVLDRIRSHLMAFRYHHDVVRELKNQRWADKLTEAPRRLLEPLAALTDDGLISTTLNWLNKPTYISNDGPHLDGGPSWRFRHFQLRLLLERHTGRRPWGESLDLVVDRCV